MVLCGFSYLIKNIRFDWIDSGVDIVMELKYISVVLSTEWKKIEWNFIDFNSELNSIMMELKYTLYFHWLNKKELILTQEK